MLLESLRDARISCRLIVSLHCAEEHSPRPRSELRLASKTSRRALLGSGSSPVLDLGHQIGNYGTRLRVFRNLGAEIHPFAVILYESFNLGLEISLWPIRLRMSKDILYVLHPEIYELLVLKQIAEPCQTVKIICGLLITPPV